MAFSARSTLVTIGGLVLLGYVARKVEQRYFAATKPATPRLVSQEDFEPRAQEPGDEHLHVSLSEFLGGKQLQVG